MPACRASVPGYFEATSKCESSLWYEDHRGSAPEYPSWLDGHLVMQTCKLCKSCNSSCVFMQQVSIFYYYDWLCLRVAAYSMLRIWDSLDADSLTMLAAKRNLEFEVTNDVKDNCTILVRDVLAVWFLRAAAQDFVRKASPEWPASPLFTSQAEEWTWMGLWQSWPRNTWHQQRGSISTLCCIVLHSLPTTRPHSMHNITQHRRQCWWIKCTIHSECTRMHVFFYKDVLLLFWTYSLQACHTSICSALHTWGTLLLSSSEVQTCPSTVEQADHGIWTATFFIRALFLCDHFLDLFGVFPTGIDVYTVIV